MQNPRGSRPASGSTPHERDRRPPRLATPLSSTSSRASDQTSASSQRPPTFSKRRAHARPSYARDRKSSSSSLPPITQDASGPRSHTCDPSAILQIPIGPAQPNRPPSSPRFPPYEAFERRPPVEPRAPEKGRRPKPFSIAVVHKQRASHGGGSNRTSCAPSMMRRGEHASIATTRDGLSTALFHLIVNLKLVRASWLYRPGG